MNKKSYLIHQKLQRIFTNKFILGIIFMVYLILSFIIMINHEIWTDEAQAWLIARDLSFFDIIKQMWYEGHPCLWHFILMPFAKFGFPVITMNIISWTLVSLSIYIILFHSKWHLIVKLIIIFNPTFIYFLSAISRSYSLISLCLALFAILYPHRKKHPFLYANVLGILAHTHIIMCGFVGIASILFLLEYVPAWKEEKKQCITIFLILIIYFLLLAIVIIPSLTGCVFISSEAPSLYKLYDTLSLISTFFFPNMMIDVSSYLLCIMIFIICICIFRFNKKLFIIFLISILTFFGIHLFWPHTLWERTCILFVLIVFINLYNSKTFSQIVLLFISLCIMGNHFSLVIYDIFHDYTDSKNVATYINQNVQDGSLIIFVNSDRHVSAIPYITKDLDYYNLKLDSFQTYITWSYQNYHFIEYNSTLSKIEQLATQYDSVYIMTASQLDYYTEDVTDVINSLLSEEKIELCYSSQHRFQIIEWFYLYQYK